jgi:thiamine-monophosphate kinase
MARRGTKGVAGELALIEQIRSRFSAGNKRLSREVALGIGDDCAILRPAAGDEVLVTTDFSLENRHFRRGLHPARSVGHRCLARGLSDLAAMGARPLAAFLSLALPGDLFRAREGKRWIAGFFEGLHALAERSGTTLAGGDTSESPANLILADIVLIGAAPRGRSLRRSGARAGDVLYVTGALGGAHAELTTLLSSGKVRRSGEHPHLYPEPRLKIGQELLRRGLATAAIDVSDGLSTDLTHLCEASGLRAEVHAEALPLHPLAKGLVPDEGLHAALHGGEDYELLFAASGSTRVPALIAGVPVTRIGTLHAKRSRGAAILLRDSTGDMQELTPAGWQHFSS